MILAGDIGGTHTRLALFDADPHEPLALTVNPSREHAGLEEIVAAFLAEHPADLEGACFDVAGPVHDGRVKTTNLPWIVDARRVADRAGLRSVELVNEQIPVHNERAARAVRDHGQVPTDRRIAAVERFEIGGRQFANPSRSAPHPSSLRRGDER